MTTGSAAGTALVGGRVALLLGGEPNPVFLRRLKDAVFAREPVDAIFHVLSEAGLRNLPAFACVIQDEVGIRLLLRGSVAAIVRTFSGDERTIQGEPVTTWAEHVVRDPREVTLQSQDRNRDEHTLVLLFQAARAGRDRRRPEGAPGRQPATVPLPRPPARRSSPDHGEPTIAPEPDPSLGGGPPAHGDFDFSHLLDHTRFGDVEAAAVREALAEEPHAPPRPAGAGAELLRPLVAAVRCLRGHANPPPAERCASCGGPIDDRSTVEVERPVLGRLRFSDGLVVDLDRPLLIGRKPGQAPAPEIGGEEPGLVALADPGRVLSRVHAEIRFEDWDVVVVDRRSANGTVVELPGEEAMQLNPDQPCRITAGTRVSLAEGISFTYEARRR